MTDCKQDFVLGGGINFSFAALSMPASGPIVMGIMPHR